MRAGRPESITPESASFAYGKSGHITGPNLPGDVVQHRLPVFTVEPRAAACGPSRTSAGVSNSSKMRAARRSQTNKCLDRRPDRCADGENPGGLGGVRDQKKPARAGSLSLIAAMRAVRSVRPPRETGAPQKKRAATSRNTVAVEEHARGGFHDYVGCTSTSAPPGNSAKRRRCEDATLRI